MRRAVAALGREEALRCVAFNPIFFFKKGPASFRPVQPPPRASTEITTRRDPHRKTNFAHGYANAYTGCWTRPPAA